LFWTQLLAASGLVILGVCCVSVFRMREMPSLRAVLRSSLVVHACMLTALPLFSTDLFTYLAYGEIAARGMNPHSVGPAALVDSPLIPLANWAYTPSVYGPVADSFMAIAGRVGHWLASPIWAAGACYKLLTGILDIGGLVMLYGYARQQKAEWALRGFGLMALNPLLAWEVAGQGHNDALVVFASVVYLCTAERPRDALAVLALTLGTLSKFVLGPVVALHLWQVLRRDWKHFAALAALTLGVAAATYALTWSGPDTLATWLRPFRQESAFKAATSLTGVLLKVLDAIHAGDRVKAIAYVSVVWAGHIFVIGLALLLVWRTHTVKDVTLSALGVFIALLSTAPVLAPWYLTWLVPFAAVQRDRRWQVLVLGMTVAAAPAHGAPGLWLVLPACQVVGLAALLRWTWGRALLESQTSVQSLSPSGETPQPVE
jgi:hypothetical protein